MEKFRRFHGSAHAPKRLAENSSLPPKRLLRATDSKPRAWKTSPLSRVIRAAPFTQISKARKTFFLRYWNTG